MKKLLTLLAVVFLAVACEGPMGPQGPRGADGADGVPYKVINENLVIIGDEWNVAEDEFGPHYFADLIIPELDEEMIWGDGLYQLTWRYSSNGREVRQTLEATIYHNDEDGIWSETIQCRFSVGRARIVIRYSDHDMNREPPAQMQFLFAGMY